MDQTPYARTRVRVHPPPKPFTQEALDESLNSTKARPSTHVKVKLFIDTSNGTPEDQWIKTATRQYEKAANAAIHTTLGLDVLTSKPATPALMINGSFTLSPKGLQKSVFLFTNYILMMNTCQNCWTTCKRQTTP